MDSLKIAVIGDEDTIAGFLLAGVGDTSEAKTNFLTVDKKTKRAQIEVGVAWIVEVLAALLIV